MSTLTGKSNATEVPSATYRLQLHAGFRYADAAGIVGYLRDLGVGWVYASPLFEPRAGSTHGYDVVSHERLNPEPGPPEDFDRLAEELARHEMAVLLDVVPNHMCIAGGKNARWNDILENGPSSMVAPWFDIEWAPPKAELASRVLLPILGDQYGRVLEEGRITIRYDAGALVAEIYGLELPLSPRSWISVLRFAVDRLTRALGEEHDDTMMLESIMTAIGHLPARTETTRHRVRLRAREKEIVKKRLSDLVDSSADVRRAVDEALAFVNGKPGAPRSFDALEAMLADQAYRLSYWRVAAHEINYRRFFDINDLAAIRVEDPRVFEAVHALPMDLIRRGIVRGLRIDHIDGLFDPKGYLATLQREAKAALRERRPDAAEAELPLWVVVEKILEPGEQIDATWECSGTTGYDLTSRLGGLLVDRRGAALLRRVYRRRIRNKGSFSAIAYRSKKVVLDTALASEMTVIAQRLDRISEQHRHSRDFTLPSLEEALREVIACFPVYRTYVRPGDTKINDADREQVTRAVDLARLENPAIDGSVFEFIERVLLLEHPDGLTVAERDERSDFALRVQQLTSPVTAKGVEDTAFYRYFPLASLNEVGGDPGSLGTTIRGFHEACALRATTSPHGLSTTTTHDTKRSEDVRARISVLSEVPRAFVAAVSRFSKLNRPLRTAMRGKALAPDANDEYLFYQTVFGTMPIGGVAKEPDYASRIERYMEKALREAKLHTSWVSPEPAYEDAVRAFVRGALTASDENVFLREMEAFVAAHLHAGLYSALTQAFLKMVVPGVPDIYQGNELWDFSLVDPDNRRPVDFEARRALLRDMTREAERDSIALAERLTRAPEDGRVKLFMTWRALGARRAHRELFRDGAYAPITVAGTRRRHAIAFAREHAGRSLLCVAGRLFMRLAGQEAPIGRDVWQDTHLNLRPTDAGSYRDLLTGAKISATTKGDRRRLEVGDVLAHMPVALLEPLA